MLISITGLKPKGFWAALRFWTLAIPCFRAAQKAEGNLFCQTKSHNGYQHTLTAWTSKKHMKSYALSPVHLNAMKVFPRIATGKTFSYEGESVPSWDEAIRIWENDALDY